MENIKVLIVEDELIIAAHIEQILEESGFKVMDILTKGEEVPGYLSKNKVDIILMDIKLAGKLDGVETISMINELFSIPVIYLTSNSDDLNYNRAKDTAPKAFLSKPFKDRDLVRCLDLVSLQLLNDTVETETSSPIKDFLFVRDNKRMVKIMVEDILIVEADRNYSKIITEDKEYLLSVPMKKVEEKIESEHIVRVHRSYLANLLRLDSFNQNYLFYKDRQIPISKSYKDEVISMLNVV